MLREQLAKHHAVDYCFAIICIKMVNIMLLTDADTLASTSFDSIDRVTTSDAAATALYSAATDADIYGITRSTSSWSDGAISYGSAGTDRDLSLSLVDDRFRAVWVAGGQPKVILTHYDTYMKLQQLLQVLQRFTTLETKRVTPSVEGIKGVEIFIRIE